MLMENLLNAQAVESYTRRPFIRRSLQKRFAPTAKPSIFSAITKMILTALQMAYFFTVSITIFLLMFIAVECLYTGKSLIKLLH